MIHPFGLNDIWLVRRLQRNGMPLAIEHVLTHPHPPLWTALTAPWPWAGMGVATFVLNEQSTGALGFVQMMKRAARPEADLLYLAPAPLPADMEAVEARTWQRLLSHCTLAAASHGLQRIFASTPDHCSEQGCLKATGFSFYARETIFRLAAVPSTAGAPAGFRAQLPQDSWALQRLYTRSTPRLIQQAEGAMTGEVGSPLLSWWEPDSWQGIVWEPAGEVRGAVQVHLGRNGHWLRIWGTNDLTPRDLRTLVEQGLRLIAAGPQLSRSRSIPVYATMRDYESSLSGALTGFGFAPFMDRARFVKHTIGVVREPQLVPLTAREALGEAPIRSQSAQATVAHPRHPQKLRR